MTERPESQRDLVYNAETCRAIRRKARVFGLTSVVVIPTLCVGLSFVLAMEAVSVPLLVSFIAAVTFSIVASVVDIILLMWLGVVPEKEPRRELHHFIDGLVTDRGDTNTCPETDTSKGVE